MTVKTAEVEIVNIRGLHARAASKFCDCAAQFSSKITVSNGPTTVGGTSLMALLMLGAAKGSTITITTEGQDAEAALEALTALVATKFGEPN